MLKKPMTRRGYDALVEERKQTRAKLCCDGRGIELHYGSPEVDYNSEGLIYAKLNHLNLVIDTSEPCDPPDDLSEIRVGCLVELSVDGGDTESFVLRAADEPADIWDGVKTLSVEGAVGRHLPGKSLGDTFLVRLPKGEFHYEVVGIGIPLMPVQTEPEQIDVSVHG